MQPARNARLVQPFDRTVSPQHVNELRIDVRTYTHPLTATPALQGIELTLHGGKPYLLLGRSGIGKSTLLSALLPNTPGQLEGAITYESDGTTVSPQDACLRGWVGYMSQSPALLPWCSIRENLLLPSDLNPVLPVPTEQALQEVLEEIILPSKVFENFPHQLSFGMRQRISFARAMLYRPRFLLLDEVYTGLDVATVEVIERFLTRYTATQGAVTLIVTHNLEVAERSPHGKLFLAAGGSIELMPDDSGQASIIERFKAELQLI